MCFPSTKIDAVFISGTNSILVTCETFRQTLPSISILGATNKQMEKQNGSIWEKYGSFFFSSFLNVTVHTPLRKKL